MRGKVIGFMLALILGLPVLFVHAAEEPGYFDQLKHTFVRGAKNVVSAPWEIPRTIGQYDRETGNYRVFRDTAGFFDGLFRTATRLGCGFWDIAFSVIPGQQDGLPLQPETLF